MLMDCKPYRPGQLTCAELCKVNGWGPGTRLRPEKGNEQVVFEMFGVPVESTLIIEITAVGDRRVMAKKVKPTLDLECIWRISKTPFDWVKCDD
jgi:hypothetical protein